MTTRPASFWEQAVQIWGICHEHEQPTVPVKVITEALGAACDDGYDRGYRTGYQAGLHDGRLEP